MLHKESGLYLPDAIDFKRPDYAGYWEDEGDESSFDMYVLKQEFVQKKELIFLKRVHGKVGLSNDERSLQMLGAQIIEGIVVDKFGLASFSGLRSAAGVSFLKEYFPYAKMKGAISKITYNGEYIGNNMEGGVIEGKFKYEPNFEGVFKMSAIK